MWKCRWFKPLWFAKSCQKIFSKNFALKTKKVLENQGLSAGVVKLSSKDGSPCWARTSDIMINSHAYSRKYSRLSLLDASLTLVELYSLFSQPPVEKGYSILFLGRLPTSRKLCFVNTWLLITVLLIEDQQGSPKKRAPRLRCSFFGSPCWARTSDIMINSHALCQLS